MAHAFDIETVSALAVAMAGLDGQDEAYEADTAGSPQGVRDGYDQESKAILEDLLRNGWTLARAA